MSDKLRDLIAVERKHLNRELALYRPLLSKCVNEAPNEIELAALAAMLHSFYGGVENIFKQIVTELGETLPEGKSWHRELLDLMTNPTASRATVISTEMSYRLDEYLSFRHAFRHAYSFRLRWDKMAPLTLGCEETLRLLEAELDVFLQTGEQADQPEET
ncbi:MAG: hypothetical protein ACRD9Y_19455 [Blastocatellia bacterium]